MVRLLFFVGLTSLAGPVAVKANEQVDGASIIVTGTRDIYRAIDTTSGTKTRTPIIDVPQTIDVVTQRQISDQAIRSMADLVRLIPGISAGQGEGHRDQITLRGNNTTADFFVDGLRDDVQYYRGFYNVDRVEVHKGANAMVFGRGGGGGVVNRITKGALVGQDVGAATASVDSFGSSYGAVDLNGALGAATAVRLNGFYEGLDSHRDFYSGRRFGLNPVIAHKIAERVRLQFGYEYVRDDRVVDRGLPSATSAPAGTIVGPLMGFRDSFFGSRDVNRSFFNGHAVRFRGEADLSSQIMVSAQAVYGDYDKIYSNVYPANAPDANGFIGIEAYRDLLQRRNFIGQANLEWRGETGSIGHTLLVGAEVTDQRSVSERINGFFPTLANPLNRRTPVALTRTPAVPTPVFIAGNVPGAGNRLIGGDLTQVSLYVQDQIKFGKHWQVIAGLRYDRLKIRVTSRFLNSTVARTEGLWSPRLGLVFKPLPTASIYASWARSYLPQSGDQFVTFDVNNAALAPETFDNYEAGAKWDVRPGLTLAGAVYQLDRGNTRATGPLPGTVVLTGSQRTRGMEVTLTGTLSSRWQTAMAYSRTLAEINSTTAAAPAGRAVAQTPRDQISLWNRYDVTDRIGFGLGVLHQSHQFASISNAVRLPAFTRVDAALFVKVSTRLSVQLNVENLLGTNYFPAAHSDNNISTGGPRNARLTLTASF